MDSQVEQNNWRRFIQVIVGLVVVAAVVFVALVNWPSGDKDDPFLRIPTKEVSGSVTEISPDKTFIRIYDGKRVMVYTVFIGGSTAIFGKGSTTAAFSDIETGDRIYARADKEQDAFDFYADEVFITGSLKLPEGGGF